jgi:hypothetical protein
MRDIRFVLLLALPLAGCGSPQILQVRDHHASAYQVQATVRPDAWSHREGRSVGGIELGYERYSANAAQTLPAYTSVMVGEHTLSGPDTLRNAATVQSAHVAYSHRFSLGQHLQLEPAFGLGLLDLNLQAQPSAPASMVSAHSQYTGGYVSFTPRWRFNDNWALEATVAYRAARGLAADDASRAVQLRWNASPQVGLRLGYVQHVYTENRGPLYSVEASGVTGGLVLDF